MKPPATDCGCDALSNPPKFCGDPSHNPDLRIPKEMLGTSEGQNRHEANVFLDYFKRKFNK